MLKALCFIRLTKKILVIINLEMTHPINKKFIKDIARNKRSILSKIDIRKIKQLYGLNVPVCYCENGNPAIDPVCEKDNDHKCKICDPGYNLKDYKCQENECNCKFGKGTTGSRCLKNQGNNCVSCNTDYSLQKKSDTEFECKKGPS